MTDDISADSFFTRRAAEAHWVQCFFFRRPQAATYAVSLRKQCYVDLGPKALLTESRIECRLIFRQVLVRGLLEWMCLSSR